MTDGTRLSHPEVQFHQLSSLVHLTIIPLESKDDIIVLEN